VNSYTCTIRGRDHLACDLTLGRLGRPSTRVSGVGRAGWAGQAAFAVVGGFFLGLLAGFLIAG
jgi:hypothetical protein